MPNDSSEKIDPEIASSENASAETPDDSQQHHSGYRFPIPPWILILAGHVLAALVGLGLGYLVLHWLKPDKFPLMW